MDAALTKCMEVEEWNVGAPGRESAPRASGPARGTESQGFSFGERFALEKFNAQRLEWLVRQGHFIWKGYEVI